MLTRREVDVLLRRSKGESQQHIAEALKMTRGAVCQFEKNAEKKLVEATDILEFFGDNDVKVINDLYGKRVEHGGKK